MFRGRRVEMKPAVSLNCIIYFTLLTLGCGEGTTTSTLPPMTILSTTQKQTTKAPTISITPSTNNTSERVGRNNGSVTVISTVAPPKTGAKRENKAIVIEDVDGDMDAFFPVEDEDEPLPEIDDDDDDKDLNSTEKGQYLGSQCEFTCNSKLHHVFCDPMSGFCECEKKYPVKLGHTKGCAKPKKLGEQCFYRQTCKFADAHASCVQIDHNAICQCDSGYHSVTYARPVKKIFCTEDLALLTADVPTLLGVTTGIAVLAGLLCMVLHLYTRARHPRHPHLADASLSPPIMFTSETGIPMALQSTRHSTRHSTRPSSRSSQRSSGTCGSAGTAGTAGTLDESCGGGGGGGGGGGTRRGARGVPVSASRAGAARAAAILLISCHLKARQERGRAAAAAKNAAAVPQQEAPANTEGGEEEGVESLLVTTDQISSRRPSLASLQSSSSSVRSYSARRFEREREQKERRQQMQMRLARLHAGMAPAPVDREQRSPAPGPARAPQPTPSPNSTDGLLLPSLNEAGEMSLSRSMAMNECSTSSLQGIVGPCSSSAGTSY